MTIDPAWQGDVEFYELIYGTWLAYLFLVVLFEKVLRAELDEWRFVLINFLGATAYWVNHYFQRADFYNPLLYTYTVAFLIAWYAIGVRPAQRGWAWQTGATLGAVAYTIAFILFENIARWGVQQGYSEFWFMLTAAFGFVAIILWRGKRAA